MLPARLVAGWPVLVLALSLAAGCSRGQDASTAEPTFCPTRYSADLPTPLAENMPPRAYYQQVTTTTDTPLQIVLYACDPDHPTTSAGLTWRADLGPCEGPCNGNLSSYYGTYPDGVITYTPNPGFTGTDSISYVVGDGLVEGNIATIEISVVPPQPTGASLYLGGRDDSGIMNLWSYNSGGGLMTVPDTSAILTSEYTFYFWDSIIFNGDLYFMGDLGDGGALLYRYNQSSGFSTACTGSSYGSNFAVLDNVLYMGLSAEGLLYGYLWATDGVGRIYSVPGTSGLYIENMTAFGGSLYFDGNYSGYKQLWIRSGSGTLSTLSNLIMGLYPRDFTPFNGEMYFSGTTSSGQRTLWRTDGSGVLSTVGNLNVSNVSTVWHDSALAVFDSLLCIHAWANTGVTQLWTYHPTAGFRQITSNTTYDVFPMCMTSFAGQLVFGGYDDAGQPHLMYSNGTSSGIVPGSAGMEPAFMTSFEGKLFFSSGGWLDNQLWYITSTMSSPVQVSFISTYYGGMTPSGLTVY